MIPRATGVLAGIVAVTAVVLGPRATAAEDSLAAARELYAAAAYEEALETLNRLSALGPRDDESRAIEQYRALCLLALGRSTEAEQAIEAVVLADPAYQPSPRDVSPSVRATFSDVRRRMLPQVTQHAYADAKAAFDRKEYLRASQGFGLVLELIGDPEMAAQGAALSDLRTLSQGFRDLSLAAVPPPELEPSRAALAPLPGAVVPPPPRPRVYDPSHADVTPPFVVRQQLPPYPGVVRRKLTGTLEIVIDEAGSVSLAAMTRSVDSEYDRLALSAALGWRYVPATLNGVPVKYRKAIQIDLVPAR
jgi:tetratricopeptide (TPR) repeat protein